MLGCILSAEAGGNAGSWAPPQWEF